MTAKKGFLIGAVAVRTGLSVPAIRHYEMEGLVAPGRDLGGRRVFLPSDIRRLSFVIAAQRLGYSLDEIGAQLGRLPEGRTPTKADWARMAKSFTRDIDARIEALQRLRDNLSGCIGCGCLSLKSCALYNKDDVAAKRGAGPRYLLGARPAKPH